jgi:hypothetical protein
MKLLLALGAFVEEITRPRGKTIYEDALAT